MQEFVAIIISLFTAALALVIPVPKELKLITQKALEGTKGQYSIVVKNFKTGEDYRQNENQIMPAGSLYKVWGMTAAMEKLYSREWTEDMVLSDTAQNLNHYFGISPVDAEITEGEFSYTVNQAITQMIQISHNYAALLLVKNLGEYEPGFPVPPQTTALDMAKFFEKLYHGEIIDKENSTKMIGILSENKLNEGLPKYLPAGTKIAHKTGEIEGYKHDAGIIFTPKGDYLIVVMSNTDSPYGAEERIAILSKAVFEYFTE